MSRTYRRCYNKNGNPIPVDKSRVEWYSDIFAEWKSYPLKKYISDKKWNVWMNTKYLKETENMIRRSYTKGIIRKIVKDLEHAEEVTFPSKNYADPWCWD